MARTELAALRLAPVAALPANPVDNAARGWRLSAAPDGHVLQVLAAPGAADLPARLAALADGDPWAVRPAGPDQFYVVGAAPLPAAEVARRCAVLGDAGTLIDQSHGRVRMVLSGPGARAKLATGTALDLADRAFSVGASAETQFIHVGMHITRTAPETYELLVFRSFSRCLWDEIVH